MPRKFTRALEDMLKDGAIIKSKLQGENLFLLLTLGMLLAVGGWRIFYFAGLPEIQMDIPNYHRVGLKMEGVSLLRRVKGADLEIRARNLRPGNLRVVDFQLEASPYLFLTGAEVRYQAQGSNNWIVRGKTAKMTREQIEFNNKALLTMSDGSARQYEVLKIALDSGRMQSQ